MLDTWPELLVAALTLLLALLIILRFVRSGGRVAAKGVELAVGEAPAGTAVSCEGYVADHAAALERLEAGQGRIEDLMRQAVDRINQNDEATGALIASSRIMTKWIRRELGRDLDERDRINGDLDEADEELDRAAATYRLGRKVG